MLNFMIPFFNFFEHFIHNYFIFATENPNTDFLKGLNLLLSSLLCLCGGCITSSCLLFNL